MRHRVRRRRDPRRGPLVPHPGVRTGARGAAPLPGGRTDAPARIVPTGLPPCLLYAVEPGVALAVLALLLAGATGAHTLGLDAVPEEQRGRTTT
ncbi:hypothetical protein ACF05T_15555 [Streptomyces lateritius]|uniref:Uncharacterized protein n=1 Tax=Streptomyces lateritius TaxID=67313 RepID=A0ABW6YCF0_9ACTN